MMSADNIVNAIRAAHKLHAAVIQFAVMRICRLSNNFLPITNGRHWKSQVYGEDDTHPHALEHIIQWKSSYSRHEPHTNRDANQINKFFKM